MNNKRFSLLFLILFVFSIPFIFPAKTEATIMPGMEYWSWTNEGCGNYQKRIPSSVILPSSAFDIRISTKPSYASRFPCPESTREINGTISGTTVTVPGSNCLYYALPATGHCGYDLRDGIISYSWDDGAAPKPPGQTPPPGGGGGHEPLCGTSVNTCTRGNMTDTQDTNDLSKWICWGGLFDYPENCSIPKQKNTLTVTANPPNAGRASTYTGGNPAAPCTIMCGDGWNNCSTQCNTGVNPRLIYYTKPGYSWAGWSFNGGGFQTSPELNFNISGNTNVTANWVVRPPVCGTAAKTYPAVRTDWPASLTLCSSGSANPRSPVFPAAGGSVTWTCGTNSCLASRTAAPPVIGTCGSAAKTYSATQTTWSGDFCATGTANPPLPVLTFPAVGGSVTWSCQGDGGSTTCSANRTTAPLVLVMACGPAAQTGYAANVTAYVGALCSVGTASPVNPPFPEPGKSVNWSCVDNTGVSPSATCTASRWSAGVPDVSLMITDCTPNNGKIRLSWPDVALADGYRIYNKNNEKIGSIPSHFAVETFDVTNVKVGDYFTVTSIVSDVESAKSGRAYAVPTGAGASRTPPTTSDAEAYRADRSSRDDTPTTPVIFSQFSLDKEFKVGDSFAFLGNANSSAAPGNNKLLKLDFYYKADGGSPWTNIKSSGPSNASVSLTFDKIVTAKNEPDNKVYYYAEAYPFCIGDFKNESTWQAGVKNYDLEGPPIIPTPIDAHCGATEHTCTPGNADNIADTPSYYKWDCLGLNEGAPDLGCTKLKPAVCAVKMTPELNPVNINTNTTWKATPPPACVGCNPDSWTIVDDNGTTTPSAGQILNHTFTTIGLKTVTAKFSTSSIDYSCSASTTAVRSGGVIIER
jgi:uncharacterized repeat protein (TIGR02543 family)